MARSVTKLRREAKEEEGKVKYLFSPLSRNWSVNWLGDPVIIKPGINKLSTIIYKHVFKHVVDAVMNERKINPLDSEKRREIKEILRTKV